MLWQTHLAGGLIAGTLVGVNPAGIAIAGLSALLPDIDSPKSYLGSKIKPVSALLSLTVGHRGILHSLLATGAIYWISTLLIPEYSIYVLVGYFSHLILDSFNPQGVPLLWPLSFQFRIPLVRTGSVVEKILVLPLFVVAAYFVYKGVVI